MSSDFQLGPWLIRPGVNTISKNGFTVRLEPKVMEVLVCLASQAGEPVSKDVIFKTVWPDTFVSDDALIRSISELRRAFEDDAREPRFIETIPKRGYRLLVPVERKNGLEASAGRNVSELSAATEPRKSWFRVALTAGFLLVAALMSVEAYRSSKSFDNAAPIRSIAILPLRNLSSDPDENYLADGITGDLTSDLSQVRALRVISSSSNQRYAGTAKSVSEIAQELGVQAIVEGSVRASSGRVQVTVQLIQAQAERHLWEGRFESDLKDIVTQERKLARQLATAVGADVTSEENQRLTGATTVNPQAYKDLLLGEYYLWNHLNATGRQAAVRYLERAVAEDPTYAPSHSSLALAYFHLAPEVKNSQPNELFERSRAAAFKAAELDDSLADAHQMLGVIYYVTWNLPMAKKEFDRALSLQPGDARNLEIHAMFLHAIGRSDEAIPEALRAAALDPMNVNVQRGLGKSYTFAGRYDEAIAQFQRILATNPEAIEVRGDLGVAYERKGDYADALVELGKSRADALQRADSVAFMGYIFAKQGNAAKAASCERELRMMSRDPSYDVSPFDFAVLYAGLGKPDESLAWLSRGYREHAQFMLGIAFQPELSSLRSDPRFVDLVRRVSVPN